MTLSLTRFQPIATPTPEPLLPTPRLPATAIIVAASSALTVTDVALSTVEPLMWASSELLMAFTPTDPAIAEPLVAGLERNGFTPEQVDRVKQIHRLLYRDGLNRSQALEKLAAHPQAASAEFARVLAFAQSSERGLAPGGR